MPEMIMVPFSHLILRHREIGIHRGRRWGFRDVFGFTTLRDVPFVALASKVKDAYEERDIPAHEGWPAQREALRWLVEKGHDGIYALDELGIKLMQRRPGTSVKQADKRNEQGIMLTDSSPDSSDSSFDALDDEQEIKRASLDEQKNNRILDSSPDALAHGIELTDSTPDALDEQGSLLASEPERYYISDGHHRALALYVLGETEVRARVLSEDEVRAARALRALSPSVT